jgi:hypothetical protein
MAGKSQSYWHRVDPLTTIRKFAELLGYMEYLAEAVDDAHETFWDWVQQQEDVAKDARR